MITGDGHEGGCNVLTDRCIVEVLVLYSEAHICMTSRSTVVMALCYVVTF